MISQEITSVAKSPLPADGREVIVRASEQQEVAADGKVLPATTEVEETRAEPVLTREEVAAVVSEITDFIQHVSRDLDFQVDEVIGSVIVTVRDRETGDIVRQIPSEEVLAMARFVAENPLGSVKGLLMNSKG